MSVHRTFKTSGVNIGGRTSACFVITCAKCGVINRISSNDTKSVPPDKLSKKWTERGWFVGHDAAHDLCPDHVARARAVAERVGAEPARPIAEPPPEMDREGARIIFAKIEEHYVNETVGYQSGWTDKRIAEDLGVPRAWVENVREQFFGQAGGNPEIDRALDAASKLVAESRVLAADLLTTAAALTARSDDLERETRRLLATVR